MRFPHIIRLISAGVILAGAFIAGIYLAGWCQAIHPMTASHLPPLPALNAPSAAVLDPHPEAFMVQDRSGHISSSRVWKFVDDWFTDGGKLGCRRFSTEGATLEFCLDPYNTGTGCAGRP